MRQFLKLFAASFVGALLARVIVLEMERCLEAREYWRDLR